MPERTCIGCKSRREQAELWRIGVSEDGRLGWWLGKGRSAYVCPTAECSQAALGKGRLERTLKRPVTAEDRERLNELFRCKLR